MSEKRILVEVLSNSIGDTIAAIPYIEVYKEDNPGHEVFVETSGLLNKYLSPSYPKLKFVKRGEVTEYDEKINLDYDFNRNMIKGYARQMGYEGAKYIRPRITPPTKERPIKGKYVTIGIHSTAQLKYWNHPGGITKQGESPYWNELCAMLRKEGYTPIVVEKNEKFGLLPHLNGTPRKANTKILNLEDTMNYMMHSEFYIGLSSGLSWLAHALGKPVAMISNFSEDWHEMDPSASDYKRITNKSVCHGCWNTVNIEHSFDANNWYWCPRHAGTNRMFECHTSITPEMVFDQIKGWMI